MPPLVSLLVFAVAMAVLALFFWPDSGLLSKWRKGVRSTERVLVEDTLKHLQDQEHRGDACTIQSISETLSIPKDRSAKLMTRLETLQLVESREEGFTLTSDGRHNALRMIRIHRLWERYFADETGITQTEWHERAEKLEHNLSEQQAAALASAVGNPIYDPDGDPIPTPTGSLPPTKGFALIDLDLDEPAYIIHIEDEPTAIYAQLVAEGLHPHMQLRVVEKTEHRLRLIVDGEEIVLAPVVAANVTVELLPKERSIAGQNETIAALRLGEEGEVIGISAKCRGQQRRRLMDLGVIPGTVITAEIRSAAGDPTAYSIRGAKIALRRKQAEMIHIKPRTETYSK